MVQRGHHFAIVDEVDSILIDEARTPLIISGPGRRVGPALLPVRRHRADPAGRGRLRGRRGEAHRGPHRGRHREGREAARGGQPLRRGGGQLRAPPDPGPLRQGALPAGQGLPGGPRRGEDRRRVHRADPRRAAVVGRPPPGGRGQGAGADQRGEPHLGHGDPPELLPALREAVRDDRYGRDRGVGVRQHLRAPRRPHPSQQAADPRGQPRPHLQVGGRQVRRGGRRHRRAPRRRASRCWWARPRCPSPSTSPGCSRRRASPTRSSTPSSTSGRRRSWPRPAGWAG